MERAASRRRVRRVPVKFGRLNVDDNQSIAMRFDVYAIPTFVMFMDGQPLDRAVGAVGENGLENLLQKSQ